MRIKIRCEQHECGLSGEPFFVMTEDNGEWVVDLSNMWCQYGNNRPDEGEDCSDGWTVQS
jgi:hypothetical protein